MIAREIFCELDDVRDALFAHQVRPGQVCLLDDRMVLAWRSDREAHFDEPLWTPIYTTDFDPDQRFAFSFLNLVRREDGSYYTVTHDQRNYGKNVYWSEVGNEPAAVARRVADSLREMDLS